MNQPGEAAVAAATTTNDQSEIVKLAIAEGHDADIPSNAGYVDSKGVEHANSSLSGSNHDEDPEKDDLRHATDDADPEKDDLRQTTDDADPEKAVQLSEKEAQASAPTEVDPNIVDWDGPDDPQNPLNWSATQVNLTIFFLSMLTFVTPLASSMFAPGVPAVMAEFKSDSNTLAEFVVSVYILGFAVGPLLIGPLSEVYGRWPVYSLTMILFTIFTIACAVAPSLNALIVFRFFAGALGVTPVTIGGGTLADMVRQEKRGAAMAVWAMGPLIGPVVGPIAGGYLTGAKGWRWTFWLLTMIVSVVHMTSQRMLC